MLIGMVPMYAIADESDPGTEVQETGSEEQETAEMPPKADYVGYVFPYRTSEGDQKQSFLDAAKEHVNVETDELDVTAYHAQIYGYQDEHEDCLFGAEFLCSCASEADLLDCRMFMRTENCNEQLRFLRDVNGFPCYPLSDCSILEGTEHNISEGDIIFWTDTAGRAINAGVVISVEGGEIHAVVSNSQIGYAELVLNTEVLRERKLTDAVVINPEYPCYERLIFFYCINELGLSISSACGVMCNIYHESGFDPDREEELNGLGYGLCQWSRNRRQMLEDWCASKNRDYTKLYSQLDFMIYELELHEPGLHEYLQSSFASAYDAGYKFCIEYECPDGGEAEAQNRGQETINRFFNAYGGHPYM